jgi:hypothetical protein
MANRMNIEERRKVAKALLAAAVTLEAREADEPEHFETTDEMYAWAKKHEGEKDPPAPGVEEKETSTDSVEPETFGRLHAAREALKAAMAVLGNHDEADLWAYFSAKPENKGMKRSKPADESEFQEWMEYLLPGDRKRALAEGKQINHDERQRQDADSRY